ncbi:MAG: RcpC/CpaB family pilus assembly protein [Acidimicrobiia bacterium]|nr:RcpC/CpaB family pilus assembly protein [Acidimicrobiia bacterium]
MSSRRTLILLGAIAVGIVAAFALFNYVSGIEDREREDAQLVPVLKADGDEPIPRGITGQEAFDQDAIVEGEIPREFQPEGFVSTIDEIAGQEAVFDIPPGTVLVRSMFVDPSEQVTSFRQRLKDDGSRVAMSISVDQVRGVADFLVPGDEVAVFLIGEADDEATLVDEGAPCDNDVNVGCLVRRPAWLLYRGVRVLAVGQTTVSAPGEGGGDGEEDAGPQGQTGLLTLEVPIEAAQWFISVPEGSFYLALEPETPNLEALPPNDLVISTTPGADPAEVTPYGPEGETEE